MSCQGTRQFSSCFSQQGRLLRQRSFFITFPGCSLDHPSRPVGHRRLVWQQETPCAAETACQEQVCPALTRTAACPGGMPQPQGTLERLPSAGAPGGGSVWPPSPQLSSPISACKARVFVGYKDASWKKELPTAFTQLQTEAAVSPAMRRRPSGTVA